MRTHKTQGLIIKKQNLGEKDYTVTLFSPDLGRIRANAKGAKNLKSKFTGHLNLLNICNFEIYRSTANNYLITECQIKNNFSEIGENLDKFFISNEIAKILNNYTYEIENCSDIYNLVIDTLEALNNYKKENFFLETFKIKFYSLLGIMPDLDDLKETQFSKISERNIKLLKFLLKRPYKEIKNIAVKSEDINYLNQLTTDIYSSSFSY